MFNFGRKKNEDPKKALEDASNMVNKGVMGGLTKAFMGKDFVDQTNQAINMGNQALDSMQMSQTLAVTGADAMADVLSITDTGQTINMNPVVVLVLSVTPAAGAPFQTAAQVMVPRLTIPRPGDKIRIKYNPAIPTQIAIV
jgi:hypothetical protein